MRNSLFAQSARYGRRAGFTFVELLVVIAVIAILVLISMTAMQNFSTRNEFDTYTETVRDTLMLTHTNAVTGYGGTPHGIYVGTTTIEFFASTTPTVGNASDTIMTIPSYLDATSSFTNGSWFVTFAPVTGIPNATGTITFTDTRTFRTATITINAAGLVQ